MKDNERKELLNKIWKELDYWCEQYKYVNNVLHDIKESERVSNNIKALERVYKIYNY